MGITHAKALGQEWAWSFQGRLGQREQGGEWWQEKFEQGWQRQVTWHLVE